MKHSQLVRCLLFSAGLVLPGALPVQGEGAESIPIDENIARAALAEHCVQCHGKDGKGKGEINLLELESLDQFLADSELPESVVFALEDGDMPPEDEPQLPDGKRTNLLAELDAMLTRSIAGNAFAPIRMPRQPPAS